MTFLQPNTLLHIKNIHIRVKIEMSEQLSQPPNNTHSQNIFKSSIALPMVIINEK